MDKRENYGLYSPKKTWRAKEFLPNLSKTSTHQSIDNSFTNQITIFWSKIYGFTSFKEEKKFM